MAFDFRGNKHECAGRKIKQKFICMARKKADAIVSH